MDLNAAIRMALSLVEGRAKAEKVELVRDLPSGLAPIRANRVQLQQVIINLVNNALDAAGEGGTITVRTGTSAVEPGCAEILVQDDGPGIPENIRGKIFEPFFTTKETGKGTGLGLSLVYEIVKKHNGTIEVESEAGKGAKFTVLLPFAAGLAV
ncbi:MAG: hypothetical protein A2107_08205 [Verrucomicrobia bacterium GWF2_62_7]|nr:MAG: hypothetical protein A2107_08205 [Verrucomicrobia bacterium GWF2_62_7]